MKEFKYKTSFSSTITINNPKAKEFISQASLSDLRKFIPKIQDQQKDILLPISANACVAGMVNKNDDGITLEKGLEIYKLFPSTFADKEHGRSDILGYISNAYLTEYGSDEELTEEEIKKNKTIFNITLGGILWRVINDEVCQFIEQSNDPKSDNYLKCSFSWELAFSDFSIARVKGNTKNLSNAEIISDPEEVKKLEGKLKCYGGLGKSDDGTRLYRIVTGEVLPLGVGIVQNPAAAVQGVAIEQDKTKEKDKTNANLVDNLKIIDEKLTKSSEELNKSIEQIKIIAQQSKTSVKDNDKIMKIKNLQDINDENLKEAKASVVLAFIDEYVSEKIKEADTKYKTELEAKNSAVKTAEEAKNSVAELNKRLEDLNKKFDSVKAQADNLQKEKDEAQKLEKFNVRMTKIDETFELSKEQSEVIAKKIKEMTDEVYSEYEKELDTLMAASKKKKPAAKKMPADNKEEENKEKMADTSKASVNNQEVVDTAIDKGEKDKNKVANSTDNTETSLKQKYAKSFALDQFEIKIGKR